MTPFKRETCKPANTYRLQIALHIPDIPTPRAPRVARRFLNHMLLESFPVEYPIVYDLEADHVCALLEDRR